MAGTQHLTYKKRLRRSDLSPLARHIAATIADLRYEANLASNEPLSLTRIDLARECGMSVRTLTRHIDECIDAGWIVRDRVHRSTRETAKQQANEYRLADPTETGGAPAKRWRGKPMTDAEKARLRDRSAGQPGPAETGSAGQPGPAESAGQGRPENGQGWPTEYVVTQQSGDGPPLGGAGVRDTTEARPAALNTELNDAQARAALADPRPACDHGEPRGPRYCAFCRRQGRHLSAVG